MACAESAADGRGDLTGGDAFAVRDVDLEQAAAVVERHRPAGGDIGGVVEVGAEKLPFLLHHADHPVALAADADALAEGIGGAEQLVLELCTQHREGARAGGIVRRKEAAAADLHREDLLHRAAHSVNGGATHAALGFHFGVSPYHRGDRGHPRQAEQRGGVLEGELSAGVRQPRRTAASALATRGDADHVGAELAEFGQHEAVDALADRRQQDDRGDADGDAEQRQEAAHPVGGDRAQRERQHVAHDHGASASPGRAPDRAPQRGEPAAPRTEVR